MRFQNKAIYMEQLTREGHTALTTKVTDPTSDSVLAGHPFGDPPESQYSVTALMHLQPLGDYGLNHSPIYG